MYAIRAFNDALERMHGMMKGEMEMNASDLAAIRMLIIREQRGSLVSPAEIARHLRISTASTTKLLDRLAAAGFIEREVHPRDRRARVVRLTEHSRRTFFRHAREHLERMREVAAGYGATELRVVTRFLGEMTAAIDA
jgi:DNA-binding MarR family transcriptional regulator